MRDNRGSYRDSRDSRGGGRSFHGGGGRRFQSSGPREMHDATCSDCGATCKVPFTPTPGRPVYCDACFPNHRPSRDGGSRGGGSYSNRRSDQDSSSDSSSGSDSSDSSNDDSVESDDEDSDDEVKE